MRSVLIKPLDSRLLSSQTCRITVTAETLQRRY
jgi:hypothetical protein